MLRRAGILLVVSIAAVGIAVARGKKAEEPPTPAPDAQDVPAAPPAPPPPPPAPKLFTGTLPLSTGGPAPGVATRSAQTCRACHPDAYTAWAGSAHARAAEDARWRAAWHAAGDSTACAQCHLPLVDQHARLAAGYDDGDLTRPRLQDNAAYDSTLASEGVTCVACHMREGRLIGTHGSTNAPHATAASAELGAEDFCAACHALTWPGADRPAYDTQNEWQSSGYGRAGVSCQECHGAHGVDLPADRALTTLVEVATAAARGTSVPVKLTLLNTGAGHSLPTGAPGHAWTIETVLLDAAGKNLDKPFAVTLERRTADVAPFATLSDTRIPAAGRAEWSHTFAPSLKGAAGRGAVEVRLAANGRTTVLRRVGLDVR